MADDSAFFDDVSVSDDAGPERSDELDDESPDDDAPDDESPDDEPLSELPDSANATAGVLATAIPTPSATAKAHMQPMCFAFCMGDFPSLNRAASTARWSIERFPLPDSRQTAPDGSIALDDGRETLQMRCTRGWHEGAPDAA